MDFIFMEFVSPSCGYNVCIKLSFCTVGTACITSPVYFILKYDSVISITVSILAVLRFSHHSYVYTVVLVFHYAMAVNHQVCFLAKSQQFL